MALSKENTYLTVLRRLKPGHPRFFADEEVRLPYWDELLRLVVVRGFCEKPYFC